MMRDQTNDSTFTATESSVSQSDSIKRLISRIRDNDPSLTKASLFDKAIGDFGAGEVAEALRFNGNLSLLDLGRNGIKDEGASVLASSLQENETLRMLWLRDNEVGTRGAAALADAISLNKGLSGLSLGRNQISPDGAADIATALRSNTTLKAIWLYGNGIGDNGAASLADALKANSSLNELCLGNNGITEEGARVIAYTLLQNSSLTLLELNRNRVGSAGARALANTLQSNSTLAELSLRRNEIRYAGVQALVNAALGENATLSKLDLRDNSMTEEEIDMVEREVARLAASQPFHRPPCTVLLRSEPTGARGGKSHRPPLQNGESYARSYKDHDLEKGRLSKEHRALMSGQTDDDFNNDDDDEHEHELYDDVYSMLFLSTLPSVSFFFSISTYVLKTLLFAFVIMDFVSGGYPGNLLNIPGGVSVLVRMAQFFMLIVAVAMQEDLISCMALANVKYTYEIMNTYPGASYWKWILATCCRLTDGLLSLTINFFIIIQANEVLGMMLNFAALHFLQSVDNVAFHLALDGYFGDRIESTAQSATVAKLPMVKSGILRSFDTIMFLVVYLACLTAWSILTVRQMNGDFVCQSFDANFGDQSWGDLQLGVFSGTYVQLGNRKDRINRRAAYRKRTERETNGLFAYCETDKVWGFTITDDPCENILYSSDAEDIFDVTEVTDWFYRSLDDGNKVPATDFNMQCN